VERRRANRLRREHHALRDGHVAIGVHGATRLLLALGARPDSLPEGQCHTGS
jgi:hypothetical protein